MPSSSCDHEVQYFILFPKEPKFYIHTWKRLTIEDKQFYWIDSMRQDITLYRTLILN